MRTEQIARAATHDVSGQRVSAETYARAERFLPWNAQRMISRLTVEPHWTDDGSGFWYRIDTSLGWEFVQFDPELRTRRPAFDHAELAAALSVASGIPTTHDQLPFETFSRGDDGTIRFRAFDQSWSFDPQRTQCEPIASMADAGEGTVSPDGRWVAIVTEDNLNVRSAANGEVRALTTDGTSNAAYATPLPSPLAGAGIQSAPQAAPLSVIWSPDSQRLLTYRIDQRGAGLFYLVQSVPLDGSVRPKLHSYAYPLPGDEQLPIAELFICDIASGQCRPVQGVDVPLLYYGSRLEADSCWWSDDGQRIYLFTRARGYQSSRLSAVDAVTGASRLLVEESASTAIDPHPTNSGRPLVQVLNDGSILWFSQRDGWGHLYLYDGNSGELQRQMTSGPWLVTDVLHVDEAQRIAYLTGVGREPERDPYFNLLYRVSLDGGEPELLTPEDATHQVTFSPSGSYFIDSYSRVDVPPTTVVRQVDGSLICELEQADVHALLETGWRPPERFRVKARDGVTDIYGVLILPSGFDRTSGVTLPVLDSIYAGPQTNQAPTSFGGFSNTVNVPNKVRDFWHGQAFAELGFAVVMIDGLGMPFRAKTFHDRSFRALGDGGIEDHVVALRQLAQRHPFLDVTRVGIFGHSAGGYASTRAMLAFPDFYKVAVSSAGNHDHRLDKASWVERYMGLPVAEHYHEQSNVTMAHRLRGKLLLMHGEMDENVHPASTLQVVDALIRANKDFDLLILPNRPHGCTSDPYFVRRRWDYFVRHLRGETPPADYAIASART